jgi:tetratricopeptide (TPR) repeat protein
MTAQSDLQDAQRYLQTQNYKRALKAAQSAVKKAPGSPVPPNVVGIAQSALGKPRDAIRSFQKALQIKPDFLDAQKNLAQTLLLIGEPKAALSVANKVGVEGAADRVLWYLKAQCQTALGRDAEALASVDRSIEIAPGLGAGHKLRARILLQLGRIKDALTAFDAALRVDPKDVDTLTAMSLPLARHLRSEDALSVVKRALELDPEHLPARVRLGMQFVEMGRPDDAKEQFRAVLEKDGLHPDALEQLSQLLHKEDLAQLERPVRAALKSAPKNSEARASLYYALSHVMAAKGAEDDADQALASANREMASILPYDAVSDAATTDAILARFPDRFAPASGEGDSPTPIFVLGLPRSGTTLAEAVLGAHPDIAPLGELGTAGFLLRQVIEDGLLFGLQEVENLVSEDQRLLPALPEGTRAYVDKMPENYRLIGFLKTAYPSCKIIQVTRDPRDIALSMWKSHFSGTVLSYTYDLHWMAHRFNLYAKTMAHWHRVLPDQILSVRYEDLVTGLDTQSRRMAAFCDVDWVPEMLHPGQSAQQVLTLSASQLRRAVHADSVGKWKAKAVLLEPFVEGLDKTLWPMLDT